MKKKVIILKRPFRWFRTTRKRNKILVLLGIFSLLFVIMSQLQTAQPSYITQQAKRETIVEKVSETGNVDTAGRADVYSTTTGVIEEIYVDNESVVAVGENLFKVRSTATEQEKAAAYANYQSALNSLNTANQSKLASDAQMWQAQQALLDVRNTLEYKNNNSVNPATGKDYTQLEKESIDTAVVQAEKNFRALEKKTLESDAAIEAANAQVASALLAFQATNDVVVTAPSAGTITNLSSSVGDMVAAGASVATASLTATPVPPVLTIANLDKYAIKITLNEVDIPKVSPGQRAEITLDAFSGKEFVGRVEHVDTVGTNTQGIITYTVLVTITNPDPNIKPGMTANVDIEVDKKVNVLSVPNSAVKPYKGGRAVRIVNAETKEMEYIPVEIGIKGEERTEITKGIVENQEIIVSLPNDQIKRPGLF